MNRVFRAFILLIPVVCLSVAAFGQNERHPRKYVPPPPTAHVQVTVVKAWNGRPILNAAVVFRPSEDGKEKGAPPSYRPNPFRLRSRLSMAEASTALTRVG